MSCLPSGKRAIHHFQETLGDEELIAKALMATQRVINEKEQKLQAAIQTKAWIGDKITAISISVGKFPLGAHKPEK